MENLTLALGILFFSVLLVGCSGKPDEEVVTVELDIDPPTEKTDPNLESDGDSPAGSAEVVGKTLPGDFPDDIPIADYMLCESITRVRDEYMIMFHAKDKSVGEVVEWFETKLKENSWSEAGTPSKSADKAILAYSKSDRNCGVSITGFVLDAAMQRDDTTCGINIQTKVAAD